MRTARRAYLYTVSLIGLEVILWGVIGLLRTLLGLNRLVGGANLVAQGLALTLVGIPVFWLHWWLAQRDAARDPEEQSSRLRAVFLYAALLALLVPIVQNGLALVNHLFLPLFGIDSGLATIGQGQVWTDNLIAMLVNGVAAFYFFRVLSSDWQSVPDLDHLVEVRRLYRYVWMIYGLGLTVIGVQQILVYILNDPPGVGSAPTMVLANGLSLLLVGVPLWLYSQQRVDELWSEAEERDSLLRRVLLYLLALAGIGAVLSSAGFVLANALRWVLGEATAPREFLNAISGPLSIAVPLAGVWAYYGRRLRVEMEAVPDTPRRAGLRRLYFYIQSMFGLGAMVYGLRSLLSALLQLGLGSLLWETFVRGQLSNALAALALGLPLWLLTWGPMQAEASQRGDAGDHARRSIIRKAYLYLVLFLGVVLSMVFTGRAIYVLLIGVLGNSPTVGLLQETLDLVLGALLFILFSAYHARALREDNRLAERALAARHAQFPAILLDSEDGSFGEEVVLALKRHAPSIPVAVQPVALGIPGEEMTTARAVVLPASLATQPPEALRIWLQNFPGRKLVVPMPEGNWLWLGSAPLARRVLAEHVALALRQMAEDQPVRTPPPSSPWVIVGYVFAGLFAVQVIVVLLSALFGGF